MPATTVNEPDIPTSANSNSDGRWGVLLVAATAAFGTYFSMYAFRKPFTAAGFDADLLWGYQLKTVLVTAQVLGYFVSKIVGIRLIAETEPHQRPRNILVLIALAELALVLFAVVPLPWKPLCLFLNGLPLGMVFGQVMGYLEGRRASEALTAGLCASFIVADGATRAVGAWLLRGGISEYWMPCLAGLPFVPVVLLGVLALSRVPPPSRRDVAARSERVPMTRLDRRAFLRRYGAALAPLVLLYVLITIVRSLRSDFAREIFLALGQDALPSAFAWSEIWVGLVTLVVSGSAVMIPDNRQALRVSLAICGVGTILLACAVLGQNWGWFGPFPFMVLLGIGLYLPYLVVHTSLFERLLGLTRERGNVGFLMYVADSAGYLGYVVCMLLRNAGATSPNVVGTLRWACGITVVAAVVCLVQASRFISGQQAGHSPHSLSVPEPS
jgi:hypothetical protein